MRLTKQTGYALRILLDCALAGENLIKVSQVASRHRIAEHNLFKVLPLLVRGGFVHSIRGRNGGIRLAQPPESIHLGDVVRATEVTNVETESADNDSGDGAVPPAAPINQIFDDALEAFIEVLNGHTLADLKRGREQAAPLPELNEPAREDETEATGRPPYLPQSH